MPKQGKGNRGKNYDPQFMGNRDATIWARHHKFRYPNAGKKLTKYGEGWVDKAAKAEDSAYGAWKALRAKGSKRRRLIKKVKRGRY